MTMLHNTRVKFIDKVIKSYFILISRTCERDARLLKSRIVFANKISVAGVCRVITIAAAAEKNTRRRGAIERFRDRKFKKKN